MLRQNRQKVLAPYTAHFLWTREDLTEFAGGDKPVMYNAATMAIGSKLAVLQNFHTGLAKGIRHF